MFVSLVMNLMFFGGTLKFPLVLQLNEHRMCERETGKLRSVDTSDVLDCKYEETKHH
jgi:hypothetical protein